jgi:hypothetical protein
MKCIIGSSKDHFSLSLAQQWTHTNNAEKKESLSVTKSVFTESRGHSVQKAFTRGISCTSIGLIAV